MSGAAPTPAYRLERLSVSFASHEVLHIERLEIGAGELTAVLGPNGSGKTTLLRVLALLQRPDTGRVALFGRAVEYGPRRPPPAFWFTPRPAPPPRLPLELRRRVTYVAQAPVLFHRSVRANVAYGLRARGRADAARVQEALAATGLSALAERPAPRLSGGERQRVAVARALALDADAYLFDEPTAHLDRQHVPLIEDLLRGLAGRGKTVVFTTHDHEQAARLTTRRLQLADGLATEPA